MRGLAIVCALASLSLGACKGGESEKNKPPPPPPPSTDKDAAVEAPTAPIPPLPALPAGLPPAPKTGATAALVARGAALFSDENRWGGRSCATCHDPERAFTSEASLDATARGKTNLRHTPTLTNLAFARSFYWDGRATSIMALLPGHARGQLGVELDNNDDAAALIAYVNTRYLGDAPWDRHESGETGAVDEAAVRGATVFTDRAGCAVCHPPPLYTDLALHDSVVPAGAGPPDPAASFKTPSLRGLSTTKPYFHAGTAPSLEAAVALELTRDNVELTESEQADLLAFLRAL